MGFEEKIGLEWIKLKCPKCGYEIGVEYKNIEKYLGKKCDRCGKGIIFTQAEYDKLKEFEKDATEGELRDLFSIVPKGKFIIRDDGELYIQIEDDRFEDDPNRETPLDPFAYP